MGSLDIGQRSREDGVLGLRYLCDLRTLLWVAIYFALTVYTWTSWAALSCPARAALCIACALFSFFGATITHNAIHVPLFTSPTMNSLFMVVLTHTYGWPVSALIPGHNLSHHKFTNEARDAMRPQRMRYSWNLLNYLLFPVQTVITIAKFDAAYMAEQRRLGRPIWYQYLTEAASFWPVQAALCWSSPQRYFWVVFLPQLYAKYQIIAMNILQHDGCPTPVEDKWNHARNFVGRTINFLTFNNGYHTVHHLNAGMHWSRLPELHDRLVKPRIHPNLDQANILTFFWRAHIWPGERLWYNGSRYKLPDPEPDAEWYDGTAETFSDAPPQRGRPPSVSAQSRGAHG
eukprot:TRINITY_DN8574_c0_g1_i1.p1 TRINITY_DN8574_c0_g1~~TRINITY_DN8574_c0_g1_i1.p1  ORF type:complete len:373 (+),score=143.53 TRINITY_DN8574_c0_g1_i1:86-1120(+)